MAMLGCPGSWRYTGDGARDLRIDFVRGCAVVVMLIDHLGRPSLLHAVTGGDRVLTSAAEAFVVLAGLMVGRVYGDRVRATGLRAVVPALLRRAWVLYAVMF